MEIVVGLDIGTSFIRVAVGEVLEDNSVRIIGASCEKSNGLKNGNIINIVAAAEAIKNAIESAEQTAGVQISSCVVSIGGDQIESQREVGKVGVPAKDKKRHEIEQSDIDRVIDCATAVRFAMDREMLHVVVQEFVINDKQDKVKDPLHSLGFSLGANVFIITASRTTIQNINACVNRAGYDMANVMLKTLAAHTVVTTEAERELGSVIIDLGAGTSDVLILLNDAPVYTASIPIGGSDITSKIAADVRISFDEAEKIKINYGCCWEENVDKNATVIINGVGGRPPVEIPQTRISRVIQNRMTDILKMIAKKIGSETNFGELGGNIILIGGGACMDGIIELSQCVFGTTAVRIGTAEGFGESGRDYESPEWATVLGLVFSGKDKARAYKDAKRRSFSSSKPRNENIFSKIFRSLF